MESTVNAITMKNLGYAYDPAPPDEATGAPVKPIEVKDGVNIYKLSDLIVRGMEIVPVYSKRTYYASPSFTSWLGIVPSNDAVAAACSNGRAFLALAEAEGLSFPDHDSLEEGVSWERLTENTIENTRFDANGRVVEEAGSELPTGHVVALAFIGAHVTAPYMEPRLGFDSKAWKEFDERFEISRSSDYGLSWMIDRANYEVDSSMPIVETLRGLGW